MREGYCHARVTSPGGWHHYGCSNKAKHDLDENGKPTKCGTHSKAAEERRRAKKQARWDETIEAAQDAALDLMGMEGPCTFAALHEHVVIDLGLCTEDELHEALEGLVTDGPAVIEKRWRIG